MDSGLAPSARPGMTARATNRRWEADERPEPCSLGLLPSGPDPVGEWFVHCQPPGPYIGPSGGESKQPNCHSGARAQRRTRNRAPE
ncbi:MAG: hypothetical protein OJF62_002261 [Pseudolabrys sp.]|nr:hypothetical protein [Pseudolabrys sp.]